MLSNNKRWHQWDTGAADSGFVGMLVRRSKWKQHQMDKRPLRLICFEDEAALMYRPIAGRLVQKGGTTSLTRRVRPLIQQCFHNRATDVLVWKVRGIYLALQLFFFFPQNCWDLILMLFCVVLYFHAKILLYLNVFILLNVFKILVIIS